MAGGGGHQHVALQLGAAQAGDIGEPSAEALASYFDGRKALFRAPEYRKIAYVMLTPEDQAKWTEVSDDDARTVFEQALAPQRVDVRVARRGAEPASN